MALDKAADTHDDADMGDTRDVETEHLLGQRGSCQPAKLRRKLDIS